VTDTSRHRRPIPPKWDKASAEPSGVRIRTRPVVHGNACFDAVRSNRPRSVAAMASATQSTRRYRVSDRSGLIALRPPRPFQHPRSICAHARLSVAAMEPTAGQVLQPSAFVLQPFSCNSREYRLFGEVLSAKPPPRSSTETVVPCLSAPFFQLFRSSRVTGAIRESHPPKMRVTHSLTATYTRDPATA